MKTKQFKFIKILNYLAVPQFRLSNMYIEIIQRVEIKQIITDTLWICETLTHFFIRCQTEGPKNAALG